MATNRKKLFEVLPMRPEIEGIGVGGKMYKFGKDAQMFTTQDAGLAKDIEQLYGKEGSRDVVVCEVDNGPGLTPRRVFSVPVLPWKRGEDD
jgi:hypothetical protein